MKDSQQFPENGFSSDKETPTEGDPFSWLYADSAQGKRTRADAAPIGAPMIACAVGAGFLLISMIAGYGIFMANQPETPQASPAEEGTAITLEINTEAESLSADEAPAAFVIDIPETETEELQPIELIPKEESVLTPYMEAAAEIISGWDQDQLIGQLFLVSPEALVNKDTIVATAVTQVGETTTNAFTAVPVGGILVSGKNRAVDSNGNVIGYINQFIDSFQDLSRSVTGCGLLSVCREEDLAGFGIDLSTGIDDAVLDEYYRIDAILASSDSAQDKAPLTDSDHQIQAFWIPGGFLSSYKEGEAQKLTSMSSTWAEYNKSHPDFEKLCLILPDGITNYENPEKVKEAIRKVDSLKDRVVLSCPISRKITERQKTTIADAVLAAYQCGSDQIVLIWDEDENQDTTGPGSSGLNEATDAIVDALREGIITKEEIKTRLQRVVALKLMLADVKDEQGDASL